MHSALIGGEAQYQLLTSASNMRMIDRGYVFIPYDTLTYSLPKGTNLHALTNDSLLRKAYDGVLTITMDSGENTFYESFKDAQEKFEIRTSTPPDQVRHPRVQLLRHSSSHHSSLATHAMDMQYCSKHIWLHNSPVEL